MVMWSFNTRVCKEERTDVVSIADLVWVSKRPIGVLVDGQIEEAIRATPGVVVPKGVFSPFASQISVHCSEHLVHLVGHRTSLMALRLAQPVDTSDGQGSLFLAHLSRRI